MAHLGAEEGGDGLVVELGLVDVLVAEGEVRVQRAAQAELALLEAVVAPCLNHGGQLAAQGHTEALGAAAQRRQHLRTASQPPRWSAARLAVMKQLAGGREGRVVVGDEDCAHEPFNTHRHAQDVE